MAQRELIKDETTLEPAIRLVLSVDTQTRKGVLKAMLNSQVKEMDVWDEDVGMEAIHRTTNDFIGWLGGVMPAYNFRKASSENADTLGLWEFDTQGKSDNDLRAEFEAAIAATKKAHAELRFGMYRVNDTPPDSATRQLEEGGNPGQKPRGGGPRGLG